MANDKTNARQFAALEEVIAYLTEGRRGERLYEVKDLEIRANTEREDVFVNLTVGIPNDEGTMAEFVCRDTYMFFIGPRGGLYDYGGGYSRRRLTKYDLWAKARI